MGSSFCLATAEKSIMVKLGKSVILTRISSFSGHELYPQQF